MGTNLQAFYKHFYIGCLKTQKQQLHFVKIKYKFFWFSINFFFCYSGRARVNRAGRKSVRAGRSALRNRPSWNTGFNHSVMEADRIRLLARPFPTDCPFPLRSSMLAVALDDFSVVILDMDTRKVVRQFKGHRGTVNDMVGHRTNQASCQADGL